MKRVRIAAVALALAASTVAAAQGSDPPDRFTAGRAIVADLGRIVTSNGVQEGLEVTLGGTRQVISVRGADRDNPVLLFIHGGPGAVEMPVAWTFQRPWEDFFTVVQWDQRGAGKSFPLNDPTTLAPTLTPERYRDDAIELIEFARRRYGKAKLILVGHSWGSIVGLSVAAKRPDLLYAYVGIGQIVDFRENEQAGFDWTLAEARRRGDAKAIGALEALKPYPGNGTFDIAKMTVEREWSIRYGALAAGRDNAEFYFKAPRLSPDYTPGDIKAWDAGSAFSITTLFPQLSQVSFNPLTKLRVPVVMLLGRHDYTTPSALTERWMGRLTAPLKAVFWFEQSAHLPFVEEPGRVLKVLIDEVRPLAEEAKRGK